jgi:DNA-directed RNA polymerase specialized sigma24 family protein
LRDLLDPEDLFQDTMVQTILGLDHFEGRTVRKFRAWIVGITKNVVHRAARDARCRGTRIFSGVIPRMMADVSLLS